MATCEEHYRDLLGKCEGVFKASFAGEFGALQAKSHSVLADLDTWIEILDRRPEVIMYRSGLREIQFASLALVLGQYRQAYMALRLFLEQALAGVQFSAAELDLRTWMRGERDISWRGIVDPDNGIFGPRFVRAFGPDLQPDAKQYGAIAEKTYRECSEFVHGGLATHDKLAGGLAFSENMFREWHILLANAWLVISFALLVRYCDQLSPEERAKLEHAVIETLGHLDLVRAKFGAAHGT